MFVMMFVCAAVLADDIAGKNGKGKKGKKPAAENSLKAKEVFSTIYDKNNEVFKA